MWSEVTDTLIDGLREHPDVRREMAAIESEVAAGRMSPTAGAHALLARFSWPC
jgi:hypothetical protein